LEIIIVIFKSVIIGGLMGFAAALGATRMFHSPTVQALGAFRTLGEMNACEGDAASHFSFGLGSSLMPGHQQLVRGLIRRM
jgi:hypothetical protein